MKNEQKTMSVVIKQLSEIVPYERNPRINENAIEPVARSIKEFGWQSPIVIDKDNVIIAGHTRALAAKSLGLKEVPCIIASALTSEQVKAYRIADNKTGEIAEWNYELLPFELKELEDAKFDMSVLGFGEDELELIIGKSEDDVINDGETDPDAVPKVPKESTSKLGEMYQLGEHILLCGDAEEEEEVGRLGDKAELWITDWQNYLLKNESVATAHYALQNAQKMLSDNGSFYVFCKSVNAFNFSYILGEELSGLRVQQPLVWNTGAMKPGKTPYLVSHEACLFGWDDDYGSYKWHGDKCQTTTLDFKPAPDGSKPISLFIYLIKNSTLKGEVVIDTFGGSGSTLIACEQTNRKCRMMELDPKYCDVIRQRWAEFVHGEKCDWVELTPQIQ